MNGTVPPETEAALVVWVSRALSRSLKECGLNESQVNSFSLSNRVESLSEMNDGRAFWDMLCTKSPPLSGD